MSSAVASSNSSSPAPAEGQVWRKPDGLCALVLGTHRTRSGVIVHVYEQLGTAEDGYSVKEGIPDLLDFIETNEYVGEFDGSQWRFSYDNPNPVTVRLTDDNKVAFGVGTFDIMKDVDTFLELSTFVSATKIMASIVPARGQLWRRSGGGYAVVLRNYGDYLNVVFVGVMDKYEGVAEVSEVLRPRLSAFLEDNSYIGNFDGSVWEYMDKYKDYGKVTVRLTDDNKVPFTVGERSWKKEVRYSLSGFLRHATLLIVGPASESAGAGSSSMGLQNLKF